MGLWSCGSDSNNSNENEYDRGAMLTNWADNIIVPAYTDYQQKVDALATAKDAFVADRTSDNLTSLRDAWKAAYLSWQWVAIFEIGRAEAIGLAGFTNMYPTNTTEIDNSISTGTYNLELPSRRDQQGLPAIDYLIYGTASSDQDIVDLFEGSAGHRTYLSDVVDKLKELTDEVADDWINGYRDTFVDNDGSTATGSVNKIGNDFIYAYEKLLRTDKIATPAGQFTGTAEPSSVEAYYAGDFSKALYQEGLTAIKNFFNGRHYDSNQSGESFASFLDYMRTITEGEDLTQIINDQFGAIETANASLGDNFSDQIENDNASMLDVFDELQKNVVYFKSDMFSTLSISVDYVDSDGD